METQKTVRVAMLSFAHMHAFGYASVLNALPNAEIVVIADEDEARGKAMAERFGLKGKIKRFKIIFQYKGWASTTRGSPRNSFKYSRTSEVLVLLGEPN